MSAINSLIMHVLVGVTVSDVVGKYFVSRSHTNMYLTKVVVMVAQ